MKVLTKGRRHICDGGVNCGASKGTRSRRAKFVMSDFVRESTNDFAAFPWSEGLEKLISDSTLLQELEPFLEMPGLLSSG